MAHSSTGVKLEGQRPDGPEPVRREYDDEAGELDGFADRITDLLGGGIPAAEIAVLVRTNSQTAKVRERLTKAGIRAEVFDDTKFFEISEIRQALEALMDHAIAAPDEPGAATLRTILGTLGCNPDVRPARLGPARVRWTT
ncbi:3'-5' exonuclease [Amycolatopsis vastitatis]|uniref:UvrD-like helicase C-terminal domain-containing protein n=1 Tax=Amycolatopsis vastitatis TaxID=1905142 RepID=A0A229T2Q9_9PSEU|nr:3'-5' exonuclease [Amycolatopsis vastitatis]OXM65373.1 hypothetical protein CF165_23930 [Amycolatopsis vastitatis]